MKVYARNFQICPMSVYVCGGLAWPVWDMLFLGAWVGVLGLERVFVGRRGLPLSLSLSLSLSFSPSLSIYMCRW